MSLSADLAQDLTLTVPTLEGINRLPDGAVSIETDGRHWKLRASHQLQARLEELLERRKLGALTQSESQEYDSICDLDNVLSGFNRLARRAQQG